MSLNLYDYLTPLDNKRIENYIKEYGVEDGYIGNEKYLQYWNKSKKKLFHMLGGKLIVKCPFSYEKSPSEIGKEIFSLVNKYSTTDRPFFNKVEKLLNEEFSYTPDLTEEEIALGKVRAAIKRCFWGVTIKEDSIDKTIKYKRKNAKTTLQIQKGMKPIRAMQKILKYFNADEECMELFEDFRIAHSLIFNEKEIHGNLCISIHPLDFITMSDNDSDWSSCMSWKKLGCYRVGTVEMMNSNNVVCVYLESKNAYDFSSPKTSGKNKVEYLWNNKKWRQLFYVTKDIIVSGKPYPFVNQSLTEKALEMLRELAKENLGWTYSFGPELYKDMIHVNTLYRMDQIRNWIMLNNTFKNNIIFDTKGMYNDMFNDNNTDYLCIRNKVKKTKIISYSGKAICACCTSEALEENEDVWDDAEYNDRFINTKNIICSDCRQDRICDYCGNDDAYYSTYELNGHTKYCSDCWQNHIKKCPECGKGYFHNGSDIKQNLIFRLDEKNLSLQDYLENKNGDGEHFIFGSVCPDCLSSIKHERVKVCADKTRLYFSWLESKYLNFAEGIYNKDDEIVKKYDVRNLIPATPPSIKNN